MRSLMQKVIVCLLSLHVMPQCFAQADGYISVSISGSYRLKGYENGGRRHQKGKGTSLL
jgi:hypothetical protein